VWDRSAIEELHRKRQRVKIRVVGVLRMTSGIDPDHADEVIESIRVLGHLSMPAALRERLAPKIVRG